MFPLRESLSLSRTWTDENEVVVISWFEWQRVHAESGYHEIDSYKALWMLNSLDCQRLMEARHFVSELRLNSFPLDRTKDHEVLELIRQALNNRRLVAIQKGAEQPAIPSVTVQLRRLVAEVEKATHGKLSHQGRQYKLVVDVELASTPGRDYYEVTSQSEARAALDSVAKISPASADLLKQASDKLTKDWSPPSQPDGLILLRRIPVQTAAPKDTGPAITPSQMKALLNDGPQEEIIDWAIWIELDPDDPKAKDDTAILLDAGHEEVERKALAGCPRNGSGVVAIFKKIEKHSRYTLIRDYGPDEGGGTDTLFIDRSPAELEEECKKS